MNLYVLSIFLLSCTCTLQANEYTTKIKIYNNHDTLQGISAGIKGKQLLAPTSLFPRQKVSFFAPFKKNGEILVLLIDEAYKQIPLHQDSTEYRIDLLPKKRNSED